MSLTGSSVDLKQLRKESVALIEVHRNYSDIKREKPIMREKSSQDLGDRKMFF